MEGNRTKQLIHETVNVYDEIGIFAPYTIHAWYLLDEPEIPNAYKYTEHIFKDMEIKNNVQPLILNDQPHVFQMRYDIPSYGNLPKYRQYQQEYMYGYLDCLIGMPYGFVELMEVMGSETSKDYKAKQIQDDNIVPPMPDELFKGYKQENVVFNYLWLTQNEAKTGEKNKVVFPSDNIAEPSPKNAHWWMTIALNAEDKYPVPGELFGLGVRILPTFVCGKQKTSPYIYTGNVVETVFYTRAKIEAIEKPTEDRPYSIYIVKYMNKSFRLVGNDFTDYNLNEIETILKLDGFDKTCFTWEDLDIEGNNMEGAKIVPVLFYQEV